MRISMIAIGLAAAAAALGAAAGAPVPASAQESRPGLQHRPPLRIVVTPSRPVQRQCVDWHVIERRATGDTVVPQMRCWWVSR